MKCLYVHSWQYIYIYIYDYNLISILKKKKKGKRRKRKILSLSLSLSFSLSHSLYFYLWTIPPRAFSNAYHSYKNSTFLATWQSFSSSPLLPPSAVSNRFYYTFITRTSIGPQCFRQPSDCIAFTRQPFAAFSIEVRHLRIEKYASRVWDNFFFFFASTGSWAGFERRRYHWNWQNGLHARSRASWKFSKCFSFRSIGTLFRSTIG